MWRSAWHKSNWARCREMSAHFLLLIYIRPFCFIPCHPTFHSLHHLPLLNRSSLCGQTILLLGLCTMKLYFWGCAALTSFGLIRASHIHLDIDLDISSQGEAVVKDGIKQRQRVLESGKQVYPSRNTTRVLAENQVDLGYEIHQGFLASVSSPSPCPNLDADI